MIGSNKYKAIINSKNEKILPSAIFIILYTSIFLYKSIKSL